MSRGIALSIVCALALGGVAARASAESAAAAMAEQAPTKADQCELLLRLCHAANVAIDRADRTPWSGATDRLVAKQAGQADLAVDDARDAARVIERRSGRLRCFDDPECGGVLRK